MAGAWLLLWPVVAGALSRQTGATGDTEEPRERPQHTAGVGSTSPTTEHKEQRR